MNKNRMPTYSISRRNLYKGIKTWYGCRNVDGKRTWISLKTESRKVAQEWKDRMNMSRFFTGVSPWSSDGSSTTIESAIESYVSQPGISAASSKTYSSSLCKFLDYCNSIGVRLLDEFGKKEAEGYMSYLYDNGVSNPKSYFAVAGSAIVHAYSLEGRDVGSPFKSVRLPRIAKKENVAWTAEEVDAIVRSAPSPGIRVVWSLMAYAGMRIHEARKFKIEDIENGFIRVIGKGNKFAKIPVGEKLRHELDLYEGTWPVDYVSEPTMLKRLREILHLIGIKKGNNHTFRHSFITNLALGDTPVPVTQAMARHSSSRTTLEVYTHVGEEQLKKWIK